MQNGRRVACVWIDTGRAGKLVRDEGPMTGSLVKQSGRKNVRKITRKVVREDRKEASRDVSRDDEFVQRQAWQEQEALVRLARWANRFSPLVGRPEKVQWKQELQRKLRKQQGKHLRRHYAHPADFRLEAWKTEAFWLDITDVCRFFGSEELLVQRMFDELTDELHRNYRRVDLNQQAASDKYAIEGAPQSSGYASFDRYPGSSRQTPNQKSNQNSNQKQGLVVRIAVAGTVGASWAACLSLSEGIRLLPTDKRSAQEVLRQLPVGCLRLSDETLDLLYRLGVHRLDQLFDLSRGAIAQRLGDQVAYRCDQLLAERDEPLRMIQPQQQYLGWQLLPGRIAGPQVMVDTFEQITTRLLKQLEKNSQGVLQVLCTVELSRYGQRVYPDAGDTRQDLETMTLGLYRPTADVEHLTELFQLQWDRLGRVDEVYSLQVEFTQVVSMQQKQMSLFDAPATTPKEYSWQSDAALEGIPPARLVRLIDRLSSRLGKRHVLRSSLRSEALPEYAFETEPLANVNVQRWCHQILKSERNGYRASQNKVVSTIQTDKQGWLLKQRKPADSLPVWCWREPLEVQCQNSRQFPMPMKLLHKGQWQAVTRYWGPEKIESGWWRGHALRRDYYRLELSSGLRFWVYRTLPKGEWFLQGSF